MMDRETKLVLAAMIEWAYENDVEFRFFKSRREFSDAWPVVRFSKGTLNYEYNFWPLKDVAGQAEYLWKRLAIELVAKPLNLEWIKRELGAKRK